MTGLGLRSPTRSSVGSRRAKNSMAKEILKTPELGYVIIFVPNVARAVSFYEAAFGVRPRFLHESGQYAELETGRTALAFADETGIAHRHAFLPNRAERTAAGAEIAFVVEDVRAAFGKAVASGATPVVEPIDEP